MICTVPFIARSHGPSRSFKLSHDRTDPQDPLSHLTILTVPVIARSHEPSRSSKSSHDSTVPVIVRSDAQESWSTSCLERKRRTTYAISCLECRRRTTYAISRLHAKDVNRMHKSPRAHKSYTYVISHLRAKDVFRTQRCLQGAKSAYKEQKNLRTQTNTAVFNKSTRNKK